VPIETVELTLGLGARLRQLHVLSALGLGAVHLAEDRTQSPLPVGSIPPRVLGRLRLCGRVCCGLAFLGLCRSFLRSGAFRRRIALHPWIAFRCGGT